MGIYQRKAALKKPLKLLLIFLALLNSHCASGNVAKTRAKDPQISSSPVVSPTLVEENTPYIPDQFGPVLGNLIKTYSKDDENLSYMGYEITKAARKARSGATTIEYAVLRRNSRIVATFDSPLDQLSEVRFGLFSFLGDGAKQIVIEQTSDKFWRYWIVNLEPNFRVIYDSNNYDVVFELRVADVDNDGTQEIVQHLGSFWYFKSNNIFSPRPPILFEYNAREARYIPANPKFKEVTLKDIGQRVDKARQMIERKDDPEHELHTNSAVLDVVLRYLYAGEEDEAWSFYDKHYDLRDKDIFKKELKDKLAADRLYSEVSNRLAMN